jgi:hypothetical protein
MNRLEHRRRSKVRKRIGVTVLAITAIGAGVGVRLAQNQQNEPQVLEPSPSASPTIQAQPMRTTLLSVVSTAESSRAVAVSPIIIAEPLTGGAGFGLLADAAMQAVGPAGQAPIRQHASGFGPAGLAGALRNELGIRIDESVEITEVQLAAVLEATGPIAIDVDVEILEKSEVVYEQGVHQMEASELVTFLAFPFEAPGIDAEVRARMLADAWQEIASASALSQALSDTTLAPDAASAMDALTSVEQMTSLPIRTAGDAVVLDPVAWRQLADALSSLWLTGVAPWDRPVVELRGQTLVEPLLLLVADGIRVDRLQVEPVQQLRVQAASEVLASRLKALLGDKARVLAGTSLRNGLDARIYFPRAA